MELINAYFFVFLVVVVLVLPILTLAAVYWHQKREKLDDEDLDKQTEETNRES